MKLVRKLFLFLFITIPVASHSLELELDSRGLNVAQASKVQEFITQTMNRLPKSLNSRLNKKITIKFENIAEMGHTHTDSDRIILSKQLLSAIFLGADQSSNTLIPASRHKSDYDIALGTLIHEVAHQYDFYHIERPFNSEDLERRTCLELRQSAQQASDLNRDSKIHVPEECYWSSYYLNVSDNPQFSYAIGWQKKEIIKGVIENVDDQIRRSPYPYEFSSLAEAFAVNLEFYLLDPEFKCRRPTAFNFLKNHFGEAPIISSDCEAGNHVLVTYNSATTTSSGYEQIDSRRIYQIHYLLAGDGAEMMASWGHSMLRLVICAPFRTTVGPDCMKDVAYHKVVSYRAGVTDLAISSIKGLMGEYPSQIFILPLLNVLNEYTKSEMRDIYSYPLKLNQGEIKDFATRVIEQFWSYRGKYFFVTNNCAVETLNLLKHIKTNNSSFASQNVVTPKGVLGLLLKTGYAENLTDMHFKSGYYYWPSKKVVFEEHLIKVNTAADTQIPTVDHFMRQSARLDQQIFNRLKISQQALASFFILESQKLVNMSLRKNYALLDHEKKQKDSEIIKILKNKITDLLGGERLSLGNSYGLPSNSEISRLQEGLTGIAAQEKWTRREETLLEEIRQREDVLLKVLGPEFIQDLKGIESLVDETKVFLRQKNQ